ncbi:hypothetical protein NM688_g2823 [Phlebia brevispora]|uniref:Uncharacterized protein n=1 Tax=Phlebia brevispora TaxID=194682 RepID=A0ACC1T7Q7_9APHY|nr:hypothetical protein NM688_g2823 [Phlebia brevispora]
MILIICREGSFWLTSLSPSHATKPSRLHTATSVTALPIVVVIELRSDGLVQPVHMLPAVNTHFYPTHSNKLVALSFSGCRDLERLYASSVDIISSPRSTVRNPNTMYALSETSFHHRQLALAKLATHRIDEYKSHDAGLRLFSPRLSRLGPSFAMHSSFLLMFVATAVALSANAAVVSHSPITLPFAKVIHAAGAGDVIKRDLARIAALKEGTHPAVFKQDSSPANVPVTNVAVSYLASVGFGTPATFYDLIVDTGSSNTWCGADPDNPYLTTSSSVDTGESVFVEYGSGLFIGEEYTDTVTIGSLVIPDQGIGAAEFAEGFNSGVDGILGIGPVGLTAGTVSSGEEVPTVVDTAFGEGLIPAHSIAISFEPTDSEPVTNGELTFGGTDSTKFTGGITFTPITSTNPASAYWGIDESISYNGETILSTTAGIVDTGTTLLYIASDAFSLYQSATGATLDESTGLLTITSQQFDNLDDLVFNVGGTEFALTPNAQIWPRALNSVLGGEAGAIYLVVADIGSPSGEGLDFIDGQVFLERFYSVFDTANSRVGLAVTPFTDSNVN